MPERGSRWLPVLLLSPTLLLLLVCFATPLLLIATYSFYRALPGGLMQQAFVLDNYKRLLTDPYFANILYVTLKIGALTTFWSLVLGYPIAYSLARMPPGFLKSVLTTIVIIPLMTSVVVRSYGWMILLAQGGLVNQLLQALGITSAPLKLMYTDAGVVVALTEVLMPFMVLTLNPVLQSIDPALEHASQSLGAGWWTTFRRVVWPFSLPGIAAGSILVFVLAISAFATPRLVGGSTTNVAAITIYDQTISLFNWPFGSAISLVLLALVLVLTFFQNRLLEGRATGKGGAD